MASKLYPAPSSGCSMALHCDARQETRRRSRFRVYRGCKQGQADRLRVLDSRQFPGPYRRCLADLRLGREKNTRSFEESAREERVRSKIRGATYVGRYMSGSFVPKSHDGLDAHGATSRYVARGEGDNGQHNGDGDEGYRIGRLDFEKQTPQHAVQGERAADSHEDSRADEPHAFAN